MTVNETIKRLQELSELGYGPSDLKYPINVKRKDCVCDKFVLK